VDWQVSLKRDMADEKVDVTLICPIEHPYVGMPIGRVWALRGYGWYCGCGMPGGKVRIDETRAGGV